MEGEKDRPQQRELDVSWLAEHAKQVLRLLPGGQEAASNPDILILILILTEFLVRCKKKIGVNF